MAKSKQNKHKSAKGGKLRSNDKHSAFDRTNNLFGMTHTNPNFLPPGHLLYQRYSIQYSLGQGGFGITYLAYDIVLSQEVCIKELFVAGNSIRGLDLSVHSHSIQGFSFDDFVTRFVEEARKLAQFHHPNIVRVLDVFQTNRTAYMVMDYIKGETLKQKVQRQGKLDEEQAREYIDQLLAGVEEVHKKGMLHRDIKPDNILITEENKLVLIDFGSAREFTEGRTITQTAILTPGYAPMEQYSDKAQRGPFTDIYSIGATMYFMVTGEKPLSATDRSFEELSSPKKLNPYLSDNISEGIINAMELKPERRFQRISDFKENLNSEKKTQSRIENPQTDPDIRKRPTSEPVNNDPNPPSMWKLLAPFIGVLIILIIVFWGLLGPQIFNFSSQGEDLEIYQEDSNPRVEDVGSGSEGGNKIEGTQDQTTSQPNNEEEERIRRENLYRLSGKKNVSNSKEEIQEENSNNQSSEQNSTVDEFKNPNKSESNRLETGSKVNESSLSGFGFVSRGSQKWMNKNLAVTRFRNGDIIPEAKTPEEWKKASETGKPAWCYYNNNEKAGENGGKLYNWYAVTDLRGLAPIGWHIPSDDEWYKLIVFFKGEDKAAESMIEIDEFNAVRLGYRNPEGRFQGGGGTARWWSKTPKAGLSEAWGRNLSTKNRRVLREGFLKGHGFSVRCIMD